MGVSGGGGGMVWAGFVVAGDAECGTGGCGVRCGWRGQGWWGLGVLLKLSLDCLVAAVPVGRPDGGPRACGGGCTCLMVVAGWCGLSLSVRVLQGVVMLAVWCAVAGQSPLPAARRHSRRAVCAGRVLTRPSGWRLFRSRQELGSLPDAHTSI